MAGSSLDKMNSNNDNIGGSLEAHQHQQQGHQHGREASNRSVLSTVSGRLAALREREREGERVRQAQRAAQDGMMARIVGEFRNMRGTPNTARRGGRAGGNGDGAGANMDLEAQAQRLGGGAGFRSLDGTDEAAGAISERGRAAFTPAKSRREKEEGATLFGPNLANYFGSGSSSSGAIAGAATTLPVATAAATAAAASSSAPGAGTPAQPTAALPSDAVTGATDPLSTQNTLSRRPRLGSRGRARGASLSGLSQWHVSLEGGAESMLSLTNPNSAAARDAAADAGLAPSELAMAEGIELETLRRWIERSTIGGALEIPGANAAQTIDTKTSNAGNLCSTLQSYVNLKRNTMSLNANDAAGVSSLPALNDPISRLASRPPSAPRQTHTLQFEYDCAAPHAGVQVFIRSSRKHGSWVAWTAAREAGGLSTDLTIGAEDDGETKHYAQRGPPPHILGWPVHSSRVRKGFGIALRVQLALQLELYSPPKQRQESQQQHTLQDGKDTAKQAGPAVPQAAHIPETPGIEASRRLDDPITPAALPIANPLEQYSTATATAPGLAGGEAPATTTPAPPAEETKEQRAARERNERETLKVAVVIEALDEDGKPLREPNLQTTYLRLASMPVRAPGAGADDATNPTAGGTSSTTARKAQVEATAAALSGEGNEADGGAVVDVALPTTGSAKDGSLSGKPRAWSVQVEGQEAEIGPHRFQLQELYGLSTRPPPPSQQQQGPIDGDAAGDGDGEGGALSGIHTNESAFGLGGDADGGGASECLICLSAPPSTLLLPCTHGLCLDCAVQLRDTVKATRETERRRGRRPKRKYACPVCRRVYTNMLHLSAVDEKYLAQAAASP